VIVIFFDLIITFTKFPLKTKGAILVFEVVIIEFLEIIFEAIKSFLSLLKGFE